MITLRNFAIDTIQPDENGKLYAYPLIQDANLTSQKGDIILLVGPSGSGKSLLINILLGLVSPKIPELWLDKHSEYSFESDRRYNVLEDLYPPAMQGKIGIMFQSLGLFDDLNAWENVAFANSQSLQSKSKKEFDVWIHNLFSPGRLNLEQKALYSPLNVLSGGQRQRIAFARLLAYNPEVQILDEPTSALDPLSADHMVEIIEEQKAEHLTIIITHDYQRFLPIANKVWFITKNAQERRVIEEYDLMIKSEYRDPMYYEKKLLEHLPNYRYAPLDPNVHKNGLTYEQYKNECLDIPWNNLPWRLYHGLKRAFHIKIYRWFGRFFFILAHLLLVRALPYVVFASFFLGLTATYFSFHTDFGKIPTSEVEVANIIRPMFFEQMLSGFSIALFRILVPLLSCIFLAARSGIAITAYLTSMRDPERRQWDAFRTLGVDPNTFFFPQVFICFVFGCAILSYISFLSASFGCLLVSVYTNPLCTWFTWIQSFWHSLRPQYIWGFLPWLAGMEMFLIKTMSAGAAIAIISFAWGTRPKKNSLDTLRYLIGANMWNMMAILVIFFLLLLVEIWYSPF